MQVTRPSPTAFQQALDDQAALRESLSDEFDVSTLLDVDDQMSFRRPGIGQDVTRKLRRGDWTIQGQVDLHGLRSDEARDALGQFIRDAMRMGWRCVRVVHGKGLGSPGKTPVLKSKTQKWLVQKNEVMAFVQAKPAEGGAGALVVLLKGQALHLSLAHPRHCASSRPFGKSFPTNACAKFHPRRFPAWPGSCTPAIDRVP